MEIQIDSGIPLTSRVGRPPGGTGGWRAYPFAALEVGQSFFVPVDAQDKRMRGRLLCYGNDAKKAVGVTNGRKFAARWRLPAQEVEAGQPDRGTGVRFFRIA